MSNQVQDKRISILEIQVRECQKEISLIQETNERYFYLIESLIKFLRIKNDKDLEINNQGTKEIEGFKKDYANMDKEIISLQNQTREINNKIEEMANRFIDIANANSENIRELEGVIKEIYNLEDYRASDPNKDHSGRSDIKEDPQDKDLDVESQYIGSNYQIDRFSSEHIEDSQSEDPVEAENREEEKRSGWSSLLFSRDD